VRGCGEGELLEWLAANKGVDARGVYLYESLRIAMCGATIVGTTEA
jgi:hypothetical protein